LILFNIFVN